MRASLDHERPIVRHLDISADPLRNEALGASDEVGELALREAGFIQISFEGLHGPQISKRNRASSIANADWTIAFAA